MSISVVLCLPVRFYNYSLNVEISRVTICFIPSNITPLWYSFSIILVHLFLVSIPTYLITAPPLSIYTILPYPFSWKKYTLLHVKFKMKFYIITSFTQLKLRQYIVNLMLQLDSFENNPALYTKVMKITVAYNFFGAFS